MRISVIVPTYQRASFLLPCIESVFRQTRLPDEVLVIDDGSTDGTTDVARSLGDRIRYITKPNGGPAAARNTGIGEAHGDLLLFLDIDDQWTPDAIENLAETMEGGRELDFAWGMTQPVAVRNGKDNQTDASLIAISAPGFVTCIGSAIFRRRAFSRVGRFNESLRSAEDLDWFMRARECGAKSKRIEHVTLLYRQHENRISSNLEAKRSDIIRTIKRSLDRKRLGDDTRMALVTDDSTKQEGTR